MSLDTAVVRKIQALLNTNGCSEHEATERMRKARELMDKHYLTMSDIEIQQEEVVKESFDRPEVKAIATVDGALYGIAEYCGVKHWYTTRQERDLFSGEIIERRLITFLGLKQDVDMSYWLYEMIGNVIETESEDYIDNNLFKLTTAKLRKDAAYAFEVAMAHRINGRLKEMAEAMNASAKTATGTALMVIKNQLVDEAYAKLNLNLRYSTNRTKVKDGLAVAAGLAAGDNVNLQRPLDDKAARNGLIA